jgi:hypothetical protein
MFKDGIKQKDDVSVSLGAYRHTITDMYPIDTEEEGTYWEGLTSDKNPVYIRYKYAWLGILIAKPGQSCCEGKEMVSVRYGDTETSCDITLEEVAKLSEEKFDFSRVLDLQDRV